MTFIEQSVRDKPVALYSLSDTAPFQDYSGFNLSGTTSGGTPETHLPLYKGAVESKIFNNSVNGIFPAPVFRQGHEDEPFSLEAWVRTINKTEGYEAQPYRENIVPNPSVETNTDGWAASRGTGVRSSTRAKFGNYSYEFTTEALAGTHYVNIYNIPNPIPITAGREYTSSIYMWRDTTTAPLDSGISKVQLYWVDSNNSILGSAVAGNVVSTGNYWARMHVTATAPENAVGINIYAIIAANRPSGEKYYLDGFMINEGGLIPYFDGSMPGYEWTGTSHNSKSKSMLGVSRINLVGNPSLDSSQSSRVVGVRVSSTWVTGGLRILSTDSTGTPYIYAFGVYNPPSSRVGPVFENDVVGSAVKITAYTNIRVRLAIAAYKADGSGAGGEQTIVVGDFIDLVAGQSTTLKSVSKLTDPSTAGVLPIIYLYEYQTANLPASVGSGFTLEGIVVENYGHNSNIVTAPEYFDGDTIGAVWAGTPHASQSYMLASNLEQQIIGNQNQLDGLLVNGTEVSFTTKYQSTTPATASYDTETSQVIHVIGTHTKDRNTLYVNGEKVAEESISIEQQNSLYPATGANLYSGQSASSQNIALGGVGVYAHALTQEEVSRHYDEGISVPSDEEVVTSNNGLRVQLSIDRANVFSTRVWSTESDWNSGVLDNVATNFDTLVPQFDSNVSLPGSWEDSFAISVPDVTSIYGVYLTWDGDGSVVEASLDGQTWESAEKGRNLNLIPSGFNPTDQELLIRISFPGGFADDESYISELTAVGFLTNEVFPAVGRTVTLNKAYPQIDREFTRLYDDWGIRVDTGGTITISTAPATEPPARTIEIWIKRNSEEVPTISVSGTTYKNGVLDATPLTVGKWTLLHIVSATDVTSNIVIGGNSQVGAVSIYPTALTATQVKEIANNYYGVKALSVDSDSIISVFEPVEGQKLYAFDWSIHAAG